MSVSPPALGSTSSGGGGGSVTQGTSPWVENITQIGGASLTIGQQLSAASIPVVLPATQITALTPPAAITNYALETGGNLATLAGTVTSARAAVNLIVGQAGVAGGSGTVSALTQRVVLATDVALPSGSNVIGHVIVDTAPSTAVTNAGTFAVQAAGDVASGSADSGNPVKIGLVGKTTNPTAVTDGQRVNALADKLGKQIVVGSLRDLKGSQQTTITSSTAETTIVTADATNFLDIYGLVLTNTSTTYTKVTIKDDTAGTTRFVFSVPPQDTRGFMLPEGAAHKQAVVNKPWTATCGTSVSAVEITALFVKNL